MTHNLFNTRQTFKTGDGSDGTFYSLPQLEAEGIGNISRLPVSIRIVLESVLRNFDEKKVAEKDVRNIAAWGATDERSEEIPFTVARVILQDFTGVPLLVDLAAMRSAVEKMGKDSGVIEPLVPVDLVIDHSVQVDYAGSEDAYQRNMQMEFKRNEQRYRFLKWGTQAFNGFRVVPPGIGIVHQVNLEYLAKGVFEKDGVYYPDSLVGTDSHTTMINGLGIVGWGVGGIEAEAGMLGQPVYFLTPDVVGVNLSGELAARSDGDRSGSANYGNAQKSQSRRQIRRVFRRRRTQSARNRPRDNCEYGSRIRRDDGIFRHGRKNSGLFPLRPDATQAQVETIKNYYEAQKLFGIPLEGEVDYTTVLNLDLATITPAVAGPKRPQDRIELSNLGRSFQRIICHAGRRRRLRQAEGRTRKTLHGHDGREIVRDGGRRRRTVAEINSASGHGRCFDEKYFRDDRNRDDK